MVGGFGNKTGQWISLPNSPGVVYAVASFADPILTGQVVGATWDRRSNLARLKRADPSGSLPAASERALPLRWVSGTPGREGVAR